MTEMMLWWVAELCACLPGLLVTAEEVLDLVPDTYC